VDSFLAKGLPWTTGRSYYKDKEVLVFSMPHDDMQQYPPMINLQQYYIEDILLNEIRRHNAASPGMIDLRWASKVTALSHSDTGAHLTIENTLGTYTCEADWLVACDGGQSFVRNALGLELKGTAYQGRYAIVDIELASTSPTERRAWFDPPWARGTTVLMHRQPDNIWRVDYQLHASQDPEDVLRPDKVREFVQRHLDAIGEGHLSWTPVWSSIYRAGAMTLDNYKHGRILFAGNSAHAMPIFGVRGLNSGFDDADNLTWKLSSVLQGQAPEQLLESYSRERIQAFQTNAANAIRSTEFMSPPSRGFDLLREACLSLASRHADIARLINPRQTHAITYEGSVLSTASSGFASGPVPGAPLPEVLLEDGATHLTSLLPTTGFGLWVLGGLESQAESLGDCVKAELQATWPSPLPNLAVRHIDSQAVCQTLGADSGSAYLVRPDGHVAGRWQAPSAPAIAQALRKACALPNLNATNARSAP